ncbi:MAG: DUF4123 domain-containing protein [Pseudomonadota bacterium]
MNLQQHVDDLHRRFYEAAESKCLLWVNPAQSDPYEGDPLVEALRARVLINHPRFNPKHGPYLVPLDLSKSAHADVFRASAELAWNAWTRESLAASCGQPIAGWVLTRSPVKALALHWGTQCHVHGRGRNQLLRFHDPSVREWLWPVLSDAQRDSLLGPADSLFAFGRNHAMMRHQRKDARASRICFPALALTDVQWRQVEDYATLHRAWLTWQSANEDKPQQAAEWEKGVLTALSHATTYGIVDSHDRELFALHALQLKSTFHGLSQLQPVWRKTSRGEFYASAIEDVFGQPADQLHTCLKTA